MTIESVLFPNGTAFDEQQRKDLLEYYKLLAQHTEQQAARRQQVNNFFVSINSFLIAGVGFFTKDAFAQAQHHHAALGAAACVIILGILGVIICRNWSALIRTYAQLNHANLLVAQQLEKHLLAAMSTATHTFHSRDIMDMTNVERRVAHALCLVHGLIVLAAIYFISQVTVGHQIPIQPTDLSTPSSTTSGP
jgi:hypothetical protein